MVKVCGKCSHFEQIEGMFGRCKVEMREQFDNETFSSVPACIRFEAKEQEVCECPGCRYDHLGVQDGHPMGPMMGMFLNSMPPGTAMFMGGQPPVNEPPKEKTPWVNPLIKNPKPPKPTKVIELKAWRSEKER